MARGIYTAIIISILLFSGDLIAKKSKKSKVSGLHKPASCRLVGKIRKIGSAGAVSASKGSYKKFNSVSDHIRLHLDAKKEDKCKYIAKNYCRYNVLREDYVPETLILSFREAGVKKTKNKYTLDQSCTVTPVN